MTRWIVPVVAFAVVLLFRPDGWAASPTEQLRGFFTTATRILDAPRTDGQPEERLSAIRTIVADIFDFREAAQLSLGPEWNARTPAERTEFVRLFADLLERSFIIGIAARIHLADGVKVSYLGESIDGAVATVRTAIASKSGLDLAFSYRMIERGDRWAVRDVVIDGVSLAANYRAQFVRVMQASSYPELIRHMRARVSQAPTGALVATAVEDDHAVAPVTPPPPPPEITLTESPDPVWRDALPTTSPGPRGHDLAVAARSAPAQPQTAIPIARATLQSMTARLNTVANDGWAREEPSPAPPPRDPRVQSSQLQEAMTTRPMSAHASSAGLYWVQVGAFANPETARRLASLLGKQEPPASSNRWVVVVQAVGTGTPLARVRVGPFSDRADAASKLREFQARGYKPFIAEERD